MSPQSNAKITLGYTRLVKCLSNKQTVPIKTVQTVFFLSNTVSRNRCFLFLNVFFPNNGWSDFFRFSNVTKREHTGDASLKMSCLVSSLVTVPLLCAGMISFFYIWERWGSGSKPQFLTDGRNQCQRRPGREAGYKVGPSERQTTHS